MMAIKNISVISNGLEWKVVLVEANAFVVNHLSAVAVSTSVGTVVLSQTWIPSVNGRS